MSANRNPVDRLADVRAEIQKLRREANAIGTLIKLGLIDPTGDQYQATIIEMPRTRMLNVAEAVAAIGDAIEPFVRRGTERKVVLKRRQQMEGRTTQ